MNKLHFNNKMCLRCTIYCLPTFIFNNIHYNVAIKTSITIINDIEGDSDKLSVILFLCKFTIKSVNIKKTGRVKSTVEKSYNER